ncbi:dihydroorotate dehydrogenase [Streptomyces flavidovirens]|uniref:dihydroorotate dehydrogenase n=1 Tax=Streptomyces flavidovirens TaxID=67298 RepID=UPI00344ADE67
MVEAQKSSSIVLDDRDRLFATGAESGPDLTVSLGPLRLQSPVMPASGCFGPELGSLLPVGELGAVVTKTLFADRRSGNPSHRLTESADGMLNSVGIPSPGTSQFKRQVLPKYRVFGVPVVVSVGGLTVEEYWQVTDELADARFEALEVNVSCPNLEHGGLAIGTEASAVEHVVSGVVSRTSVPILVKLTPNVTSIGDIARAAERAGAAAVTVCNTFPGMAIDVPTRRAVLGNGVGGLSGPAVKPMALRLVWQAASAVGIPVIGCGGISTARDVVEFLLAGASAVQVGTATFTRPYAMARIQRDLAVLCNELGVSHLSDLTGALRP